LNEILRRALFRARLAEEDVAARLGVDPKTVRRWLEGRVPYHRHRQALSHLVSTDEAELWPEVHAARLTRSRPEEIRAIYPHRWSIPHEVWHQFFESAKHEVALLAYSGLFIAEDIDLIQIFTRKARDGLSLRIALGDPDSPRIAERGAQEGIGDAMAGKIRNALMLYRPLREIGNVSIRLHRTALYNSLFQADNCMLVNQHVYGIPAANAPVFHLRKGRNSEMFNSYIESFERVWSHSTPLDFRKP
jgi:transcriptional regulator with XRE-family HTH domain